jgi:hypothetical protein
MTDKRFHNISNDTWVSESKHWAHVIKEVEVPSDKQLEAIGKSVLQLLCDQSLAMISITGPNGEILELSRKSPDDKNITCRIIPKKD